MVKNSRENIFTKFYPHLDLHGETTDTCVAPLVSFINDNIRLKKPIIVVIHGKGAGILKTRVHELLKKNKNVLSFHLDPWNIGETIVNLKFDR